MNKTVVKLIAVAGLSWGLALPIWLSKDVDEGMTAFSHGDYSHAYEVWMPLAESGAPMDQRKVAMLYFLGLGVPQDYGKATQWYRKSAAQGDAEAQYQIGFIYDKGLGLDENDKAAAQWYQKAAEQDEAAAQYHLGLLYLEGSGVARNFKKAYRWLERAAAQYESLSASGGAFTEERDQAVRARDRAKAKMSETAV